VVVNAVMNMKDGIFVDQLSDCQLDQGRVQWWVVVNAVMNMKDGIFLHQLSDCQLLKKESALSS
jgi:hypothetical protein